MEYQMAGVTVSENVVVEPDFDPTQLTNDTAVAVEEPPKYPTPENGFESGESYTLPASD